MEEQYINNNKEMNNNKHSNSSEIIKNNKHSISNISDSNSNSKLIKKISKEKPKDQQISVNNESTIIISNEIIDKRLEKIFTHFNRYLNLKNITARDFFKEFLFNPVFDDVVLEYNDQAIFLNTFKSQMELIGLPLDNVDLHCVFVKLKILDDYDALSIKLIEDYLESIKNNSLFLSNMSKIDNLKSERKSEFKENRELLNKLADTNEKLTNRVNNMIEIDGNAMNNNNNKNAFDYVDLAKQKEEQKIYNYNNINLDISELLTEKPHKKDKAHSTNVIANVDTDNKNTSSHVNNKNNLNNNYKNHQSKRDSINKVIGKEISATKILKNLESLSISEDGILIINSDNENNNFDNKKVDAKTEKKENCNYNTNSNNNNKKETNSVRNKLEIYEIDNNLKDIQNLLENKNNKTYSNVDKTAGDSKQDKNKKSKQYQNNKGLDITASKENKAEFSKASIKSLSIYLIIFHD